MRGIRLIRANQVAKRYLRHCGYWYLDPSDKRLLGLLRKTRVPCSCSMCCNPRRIYGNGKLGKTFQEIKKGEIIDD
jgi:hypothetical protein